MEDVGYRVIDEGLAKGTVSIYKKRVPNRKAELANELIARWGLVVGKPDGEDSAGRAKLALMPIDELVGRALDAAELAIDEMDKRGWFLDLPEPKDDGIAALMGK